MKLLLTGATGVAGLAIYRAALTDPDIQHITLLTRRPVPEWAALPPGAPNKTTTILHGDFLTYPPTLAKQLAENDACIWALGRSVSGMSEKEYTDTTYWTVMHAAQALSDAGAGEGRLEDAPFRIVYISGQGADQTGRSWQMWANVKGRAEQDLTAFCSDAPGMQARVFRPGYFRPSEEYPEDSKHQRSTLLRAVDRVATPLFKTLVPVAYSPTEELSRFTIALAKGRWPGKDLFENADMRKLMKGNKPKEEL